MPLHVHSHRCDQLQSQEQSITVKRTSSAPGPALQGGGIRRKTDECDEERDEESSIAEFVIALVAKKAEKAARKAVDGL
jgi:hypothetical protein